MNTEQKTTFFRFDDLRIYHKVLDYINCLYEIMKDFKTHDELELKSKLIIKAESIAISIAEGSCRSKSQFVYFLKLGKSSLRECVVLTSIAKRMGFISEEDDEKSRNLLIEVSKMNRALITSLQKEPKKQNQGDDDYNEEEDDENKNDLDTTLNSNIMNY